MSTISVTFAKLAALYKEAKNRNYDSVTNSEVLDYLQRYAMLHKELVAKLPDLYIDLPVRDIPKNPVFVSKSAHFLQLLRDMEYIFEVRANSELKVEVSRATDEALPPVVFISHGRSADWREVQAFIEKDLDIGTLELAQEPNRGRTVLQKLSDEAERCSFAVVVMTGDDDVTAGAPRARENVLHEIGFFQGKLGLENVCLLHEEGTNIPSNIHGLIYIPFPKGLVSAGFGVLARELKAALVRLS
ncbi:MAG: TIR domain-containing protein [Pyrinomonadaceae bacterium]